EGRVLTATKAAGRILRMAGTRIAAGETGNRAALAIVAERITDVALAVAEGQVLGDDFWLTPPISTHPRFKTVVVSGGVGEYVNGNEAREFGDLGKLVGAAIARRLAGHNVLRAVESIRATCIGASQYTIQVSGDTLFLTRPAMLPLRDLAAVAIHPERADAGAIARSIRDGIARLDREDGAFAVAVRWDHGPAYAALAELCAGIP